MWCHTCQQDVPAVASPQDETKICCVRCRTVLVADGAPVRKSAAARPVLSGSSSVPRLELDDWELDEALRDAERLVQDLRAPQNGLQGSPLNQPITAPHRSDRSHPRPLPAAGPAPRRSSGSSTLAWTVLSIGLMVFVCGGVLLTWSVIAQRNELWNVGLPLTIASQALLVVGLVLQLEHLWQNSRSTKETLDELDEQLSDLRHATTMLSTTHSTAAQSFYAHLAEGASPQLLLSDLKGQLDMLAMRMARD